MPASGQAHGANEWLEEVHGALAYGTLLLVALHILGVVYASKPDPKRAPVSAATIAVTYLVGGLIPLLPYVVLGSVGQAFRVSVVVTGIALLVFGGVKGSFTGVSRLKSAVQTLLVGGLAAGAPIH